MKTPIYTWIKKRSGSSLSAALLVISLCPMSLIGEVPPAHFDRFSSHPPGLARGKTSVKLNDIWQGLPVLFHKSAVEIPGNIPPYLGDREEGLPPRFFSILWQHLTLFGA